MTHAAPALRRAYLDHAATTPMLPEAVAAMSEQLVRVGNASSLHASGRDTRRVVEESRELIAGALGCRPGEVVFTSGGTESDNLAVKGLFWAPPHRRPTPHAHPVHRRGAPRGARPVHWLAERDGAAVELLPVDAECRLDIEALKQAVDRDPGVGRRWCR